MKKIAILMAMRQEAAPLIEKLNMEPVGDSAFPSFISPEYQNARLFLNGTSRRFGVDRVGTQAAAVLAWEVCRTYKPDIIINVGTAGGFAVQGTEIGDLFIGEKAVHHDRRIAIPKFRDYGIGDFICYVPDGIAGVKIGVISTGNSLDMSDLDAEAMKISGANAKEMEAAAIAEIASDFDIPFIALKGITDIIDTPTATEKEFLENLTTVSELLSEKCVSIVASLS
jgi:5'-methylthioadenosine nucleosidase